MSHGTHRSEKVMYTRRNECVMALARMKESCPLDCRFRWSVPGLKSLRVMSQSKIDMSHASHTNVSYGVATMSRLHKMIGLFCRISSLLQGSFAKETCNFKEPTSGSHPISHPRMSRASFIHASHTNVSYGVATMSRLHKITGLFCRISSILQGSFAKETYHFKEPTNRSHPISHPRMSRASFIHDFFLNHSYHIYV